MKPVIPRSSKKLWHPLRWSKNHHFQIKKIPNNNTTGLTLSSWAGFSLWASPRTLGAPQPDAFASLLKAKILLCHEQSCSSSPPPSSPKSFSFSAKCSRWSFGWKFPFLRWFRWLMASASPSLPRSGQDLAVPPPQLRCSGCFGVMWWAPSSPLSLSREAAEAMAASPASPFSLPLATCTGVKTQKVSARAEEAGAVEGGSNLF